MICIRNDIDQYIPNAVILEKIPCAGYHAAADSIVYQEYTQPQDLTLEDWLILRLLYHPEMLCGMNTAECESVIRALYY